MKDRLEELRQWMKASQGLKEKDQDEEDEVSSITMQAVLFETEPVLENFLEQSKRARDRLELLETDVKQFCQQQKNLVVTMRRLSIMKKESCIAQDIKLQAENIRNMLDVLSKKARSTGIELGSATAIARIQQAQHDALFCQFKKVMCQYNESLLSKQDRCKQFIIRQLDISGKEVSEEELENMMDQGKWDVFNENILLEVKMTRTRLSEIEQRHKELITMESNIKDLKDLFLDVFMLVEQQGVQIDNIQAIVEKTHDYTFATSEKFKMASRYRQKNPLRRLCCCCP